MSTIVESTNCVLPNRLYFLAAATFFFPFIGHAVADDPVVPVTSLVAPETQQPATYSPTSTFNTNSTFSTPPNTFNYNNDMAQALGNYSDNLRDPDRRFGQENRSRAADTAINYSYQSYDNNISQDQYWNSRYNYRYPANASQSNTFIRSPRSYSSIATSYRRFYPHFPSFSPPVQPYTYPSFNSYSYPNYHRAYSYTQPGSNSYSNSYGEPDSKTYSYNPDRLQYRDTAQSPGN